MLKLVEKQNTLCNGDLIKLARLKDAASENNKVSYKYHTIDSEVLANSVGDKLTDMGYDFTTKVLLGAGHKSSKHIIEFTITNMVLFKDTKDEANGKILILNSYNGECSLSVLAGCIRFACANGLISGEKEYFEKIRHQEGQMVAERLSTLNDKVQEAAEWILNTFPTRVEQMSSVTLSYEQQAKIVFELGLSDKVAGIVLKKRHPAFIDELREEDRGQDMWSLYNTINEAIRENSRSEMGEFSSNESLFNDVWELRNVS